MAEIQNDWGKLFEKHFSNGNKLVAEILKENERLRQQIALLKENLAQHDSGQNEGPGFTKSELATVCNERDRLEKELIETKSRVEQLEEENTEFAEKYLMVEKESSNLASLYVASYQLHSTLDYNVVLQRINEILINLIGAEHFGIYVYDEKANAFSLVSGEGMQERKGHKIPLADNFLSRVARSGELYLAKDVSAAGDNENPIAALPLVASDELLGLLVVYKLLIQKDSFEAIDMELFDLLAGHAATAVRAAQLYARSERKASTLEGLLQILKDTSANSESEEG
jgi:hypothetical protein